MVGTEIFVLVLHTAREASQMPGLCLQTDLEFLATQRAQPLLFAQLLGVCRHKLLHFLLRILLPDLHRLFFRQALADGEERGKLLLEDLLPVRYCRKKKKYNMRSSMRILRSLEELHLYTKLLGECHMA